MKRILLICIIATMIAITIFVTFVMRAKCASDKKSIEYEVDQLSQEIVRHEYEEIRFQKEENQIILIDKDGNETIIPINQLLSKQIVQVYNKNNMDASPISFVPHTMHEKNNNTFWEEDNRLYIDFQSFLVKTTSFIPSLMIHVISNFTDFPYKL